MNHTHELFIASILGGAIGDALGYRVEFMKLDNIHSQFGKHGITELSIDPVTGKSLISDDTQMTLFTIEGLRWAYDRCSRRGIGSYAGSGTYQSYLRWYFTQTGEMPTEKEMIWLEPQLYEENDSLLNYKELFFQRAPGMTCLSALASGKMGTIGQPINHSKGCGGVMRVAPVGLFLHHEPEYAFKVATEIAAITHGHPTGYLSAGAFATIIAELINGKNLNESIITAISILKAYRLHRETLEAIEKAITFAAGNENIEHSIHQLGEGWIAEEALAIALYCALKRTDGSEALIISVNHDGDSDSTGAICGNILGAAYGLKAFPQDWIERIELKDLIIDRATKLATLCDKAFVS
ncbi:ADP-ribosylglycohydrolase family protein [Lederbergia galactosidilytica]|uniref:ADP-ribosylglycohydrolase n=1 Tax=Lederbergia galactosidilytica TaxID=217031 RepID=A0A177ZVN5_9BACI|nr:ADP-ribosylglycohydrolase family protein [Lederbergia galactosidilytica]KRG11076.1 hypothetical protein ACA30_21240 [Virgibacillus soli]MBP1916560.1 ADP-ribosylglycohydrolase [Lederbergia galactosidilytica]OAK71975.1 hypothetical protein ABB05_10090 [Lederbergia galactosidilytica]